MKEFLGKIRTTQKTYPIPKQNKGILKNVLGVSYWFTFSRDVKSNSIVFMPCYFYIIIRRRNMKEINLGCILIENRHKRGITQEELAAYMGVSKAAVSKWETGMTYPDITLLPQLATYFNISIDELVGYEPQMTKEQIRVLYRKLSADFSTQPIEQVRERCQEIAKKYFSCFPLLYQIGSLYVNNSTLVENKNMAIEMLEDASRLFERVKSETDNVDLAKQALNMEALCQLTLGNPKEVLTLLGEPDFSMTSTEPLLASTYHLLGNKKEARSILQVGIFQHTVVLINLLSIYLGLCLDRAEIFEETDRRAFAIAEAFNLNKLHPAIILPLYFTIAQGYMKLGEPEKTLEILEQYTQLACSNIYPLNLHGDEYFDLLDGWLENTLTLGSDMPRNQMMMQKSVSESIINCKTFESLKDNAQFQNILKRLKALEKNH